MVRNGLLHLFFPTLCSSFATMTRTTIGTPGGLVRGPTKNANPTRSRLAESLDCEWEVFGTSRQERRQPSIRCDRDPDGAMRVEVLRGVRDSVTAAEDSDDDDEQASSSVSSTEEEEEEEDGVIHVLASAEFPDLVWFDVVVLEECRGDLRVGTLSWPGIGDLGEFMEDAHLVDDNNGRIRPIALRSSFPIHEGDRMVFECEVVPDYNRVRVDSFINGYPSRGSLTPKIRCPPPLIPWISFDGSSSSAKFTCNITTERPPDMVYQRDHPLDGTWQLVWEEEEEDKNEDKNEWRDVEISVIHKQSGPMVVQFKARYLLDIPDDPIDSRADERSYLVVWSVEEHEEEEDGTIVFDRLVLKHSTHLGAYGDRIEKEHIEDTDDEQTPQSVRLRTSMPTWASVALDPAQDTLAIFDDRGQPVGKLVDHRQPRLPPWYMPQTRAEERAAREESERRWSNEGRTNAQGDEPTGA